MKKLLKEIGYWYGLEIGVWFLVGIATFFCIALIFILKLVFKL